MQTNIINELDFTKTIAIVTILSSAISILVNKFFENWQNSLKHKRVIEEKIIDTKLDACKSAIKFYGTYFNYLYNSKSIFENLESYDYSVALNETNKLYENWLKNIQSDGEFHKILLFYDFYGTEDEQIAEKIKEKLKVYFEYVSKNGTFVNFEKEKELRGELIDVINEAINYFKIKIKMIRDDLQRIID